MPWMGIWLVPRGARGVVCAAYVPGDKQDPGAKGTNGVTPPPAPTEERATQRDALADELSATGWSPFRCSLSSQHR